MNKEGILSKIWSQNKSEYIRETTLDSQFVEEVIYPAMEEYSLEQNETAESETKYIFVASATKSKSGLTNIFEVRSLLSNDVIGAISWHGAWRKYTFHPNSNTLYDNKCMIELARICEEKTKEQLKRK